MGEVEIQVPKEKTIKERLQLLSKEEKAKQLGISLRTLSRWIRQNKIDYGYIPNSKRKWFFANK